MFKKHKKVTEKYVFVNIGGGNYRHMLIVLKGHTLFTDLKLLTK